MFDLVHLAMRRAAELFGGSGENLNVFNAAGFGVASQKLAGVVCHLDGKMVETILCGRDDVEQLSDGSHYRLK